LTGPRNVIEVICDGRKAATAIDQYLSKESMKQLQPIEQNIHYRKERKIEYSFMDKEPVRRKPHNYEVLPRKEQEALSLDVRWDIDKEVELGFSKENAFEEAERCLLCHYNIFIDEMKCVLCGGCIDICPHNSIMMVSREKVEAEGMVDETIADDWDAVMAIDEEKCIRCGLCVKRCPADAIKMRRFSYTENLA
jgi:formate dehydrogenase major subunit